MDCGRVLYGGALVDNHRMLGEVVKAFCSKVPLSDKESRARAFRSLIVTGVKDRMLLQMVKGSRLD